MIVSTLPHRRHVARRFFLCKLILKNFLASSVDIDVGSTASSVAFSLSVDVDCVVDMGLEVRLPKLEYASGDAHLCGGSTRGM